jgi:glycosyltransferase involved in cell wall biosynthesis
MNPLFSSLGGVIVKLKGIRLITWYAHPSITPILRVAHLFSDKIVSSVFYAYPYKKDKLVVVGQGIDTDIFHNKNVKRENIILYAGRISRSKDIGTLIKAYKINESFLRDYKIYLLGDVIEMDGSDYIGELKQLIESLSLKNKVIFKPAISRGDLPNFYSISKLFVNLTPAGFGDKVAWEAMACETPTLVANPGMIETLGKYGTTCFFEYQNANLLALRMLEILEMSDTDSLKMGLYLRNRVKQLHSLESLPIKIMEQLCLSQ